MTVLRDGQTICTLDAKKGQVSEHVLIKHMVGREIDNIYPTRQRHSFEAAAAAVEGAKAAGVKIISYDARGARAQRCLRSLVGHALLRFISVS